MVVSTSPAIRIKPGLVLFAMFVMVMARNWCGLGELEGSLKGARWARRPLRVRLGSSRKSGLMPSTAEIFAPLNLRCLFAIRAN